MSSWWNSSKVEGSDVISSVHDFCKYSNSSIQPKLVILELSSM